MLGARIGVGRRRSAGRWPAAAPLGAAPRDAGRRPALPRLARLALLALVVGPAVVAAPRVLIVAGLGGEPDYASAFLEQAEAAGRSAESIQSAVTVLSGEDARAEAIRAALADIASDGTTEPVVLVLIGHGSYDEEHYRFNVPGPDPTAGEIAEWLLRVPAKQQLVVLATSASGAAVETLEGEGRAVVAATRDGSERNAVVFGRFWVAALQDTRADVDKDGRIDADEAFLFTEQAVAAHYEQAQRIATEHPRRVGRTERFALAVLAEHGLATALGDPALASSVARRDELLAEIDDLRATKSDYPEEDYFAGLQELLLELAAVERRLEQP